MTGDKTIDAPAINLPWLIRLRWGAIIGQAVTIFVVQVGMGLALPLVPLAAILAVEIGSNIACAIWQRSAPRVREWVIGGIMVGDVLLLTCLLYLTGGPFNPFSFLYLVHVALGAVVLSERWTWGLAVLSLLSFGALFLLPVQVPVDRSDHSMHGEHLKMHLEGMWVAFGVAAAFIVYFVQRVTRALADRDLELAAARETQERHQKFAALVTLAAGAAHELATPLSTIAIVSKELERRLSEDGATAATIEDAQLIRSQVERCRTILSQMTADSGESMGESSTAVPLAELIQAAIDHSVAAEHVDIESATAVLETTVRAPKEAVVRALTNVIDNAIQASEASQRVQLRVDRPTGRSVRFVVADTGRGMTADEIRHAGEPFYTTRPPGEGMGLGLYLARSVFGRLGGDLRIQSEPGKGTRVTAELPAAERVPG